MNMKKLMKQAQKMQKDMDEAQSELKEVIVEGSAGGEMVVVKASGQKEILDIKIKEEVVDPSDIEMLEDLILAATKDALNKAEEVANEKMGKFTNGGGFPGMF